MVLVSERSWDSLDGTWQLIAKMLMVMTAPPSGLSKTATIGSIQREPDPFNYSLSFGYNFVPRLWLMSKALTSIGIK